MSKHSVRWVGKATPQAARAHQRSPQTHQQDGGHGANADIAGEDGAAVPLLTLRIVVGDRLEKPARRVMVSNMGENTYIRVRWLHDFEDEPVDLWSELDGERFETRKLEIFRDGNVGFASATEATDRTWLGEIAVPSLNEIAEDPQFVAEEVSQEEFEFRWNARYPR